MHIYVLFPHLVFHLLLQNSPFTELKKMPLYEVQHSASLTRSEKDALASRITQIHQSAFGAPSYFISIVFKDISTCDFYAGPVKVSLFLLPIFPAHLITF